MTHTLSLISILACACNIILVASINAEKRRRPKHGPRGHGRRGRGNRGASTKAMATWTQDMDTRMLPEEQFNHWLDNHGDDSIVAPPSSSDGAGNAGVIGSTVLPSGAYGPILVVYLTYGTQAPAKTLSEVQGLFWNVPTTNCLTNWNSLALSARSECSGFNHSLYHNSWGAAWLESADVDFFEMESTQDPANWMSQDSNGQLAPDLGLVVTGVYSQAAFQTQYQTRAYKHTMIIGTGSTYAATAFFPTTEWYNGFSQFYAHAITWQTFFHEFGHNWGLGHAGGYSDAGVF